MATTKISDTELKLTSAHGWAWVQENVRSDLVDGKIARSIDGWRVSCRGLRGATHSVVVPGSFDAAVAVAEKRLAKKAPKA